MEFEPAPVVFVPSKARKGHDIAIYIHPEQRNLCYEWYYQRTLSNGITKLFTCSGCKALKDLNKSIYTQPLPSCKIANNNFITDPLQPRRPHFCQPKSIPKAMAKRLVIERCKEIRSNEINGQRQPSIEIAEIMDRLASNRFEVFTPEQKEEMVAHIANPMKRSRDNARHAISKAKQAARNTVEHPELIMKNNGTDQSKAAAIRETFQKTFGKSAQETNENDQSKDNVHRAILQANGFRYAVVDIDANTGDELYDLLVDNGFNNFVFLNNLSDHPQFNMQESTKKEAQPQSKMEPPSPMPYAHLQSASERCQSPLFEIPKEEEVDKEPFFEGVSATDLLGDGAQGSQEQPDFSTEFITLSDSDSPSPCLAKKQAIEKCDANTSNASTTDDSDTEYVAIEQVNKPKSKVAPTGNSVTCLLCKHVIMVSRFTNLTNHARRHAVVKKYRCSQCVFQHNEHARIRTHMTSVHRDATTGVIDNSTPENVKLWNYLVQKCFPHYLADSKKKKADEDDHKAASAEKKYKCAECGEEFMGPESVAEDGSALLTLIGNHLKTSHNVECMEAVCLICGYEHTDQWNVRWHLSVRHSDVSPEKNFVVLPKSNYRALVAKFFPSATGFLDGKINLHTGGARPFSNHEMSPREGSTQLSDTELSDIEQDESLSCTSLPCRLCNIFFDLDDLPSIALHAKAHYIIKQYECERCAFASNNRSALVQHINFKHMGPVRILERENENMRKAWTQVVRTCFPGIVSKLKNKRESELPPVTESKKSRATATNS